MTQKCKEINKWMADFLTALCYSVKRNAVEFHDMAVWYVLGSVTERSAHGMGFIQLDVQLPSARALTRDQSEVQRSCMHPEGKKIDLEVGVWRSWACKWKANLTQWWRNIKTNSSSEGSWDIRTRRCPAFQGLVPRTRLYHVAKKPTFWCRLHIQWMPWGSAFVYCDVFWNRCVLDFFKNSFWC